MICLISGVALFCLTVCLCGGERVGAADGDLRTTFTDGGEAAHNDVSARAFAVPAPGAIAFSSANYSVNEADGSAVITLTRTGGTDNKVVGKVTLTDGTTTPADYRFAPGTLDSTFNPGVSFVVYTIALQPDGKMIVGGNQFIRLSSDGTPDSTFNPDPGVNGRLVRTTTLQPDGKVIVGGNFTISRLNADGTLDSSFNPGIDVSDTGPDYRIRATALQPDGKVFVGGFFDSAVGNYIARLNADGSLDNTFNPGVGLVVYTIMPQPDGKVIVGGEFGIARLKDDGTPDSTFNPGSYGLVRTIALQPDGKIIIGGDFTYFNSTNSTSCNGIARLNADGSLDASFNPGTGVTGSQITGVGTTALQPDGKVIIGGDFTFFNGASRNYIARLSADGSLDSTFDPGTSTNNVVRTTALQPDGKVVIGGNFGIARLNGDLFVTWPAGDATDKTIQLPIVNDGTNEFPDETLTLDLTVISGGATLGSPNTATLTILDPNDAPVNTVPSAQSTGENVALVFSSANANQISVADADAGTSPVRVTLTATRGALTLNGKTGLSFVTGDGTSDATMSFTGMISAVDTALNGLSFNPAANYSGAASLQIVTNDQGNTGTGSAQSDTDTVNITIEEGGTLQFSAATYSVNEGAASMVINVTRTGGGGGATSIKYATSNGSASGYTSCAASRDYIVNTGTLSWADGDMANKTFTIALCPDAVYEGNETVNLTLGNVTGSGRLGTRATATLTIVDDETKPKLSVNSVMVNEGNSGSLNAIFKVTLSGASAQTVTVKYATSNVSATAPADYTALALTTLTFAPGQVSKTVAVAVKGDVIDEVDETFKLALSSPTNATLASGSGVCTIKDNDAAAISINNASAPEPDGGTISMTFTVKLSVASSRYVTVKYQTADGTAVAPADYTAKALTTLTFSPGQTSKAVTVSVRGELIVEPNETLFVNLSRATNATIADAQGQGTILNDD